MRHSRTSPVTIRGAAAALLIIVLVFCWTCSFAKAEADKAFEPTDEFSIPARNGRIDFNCSGTYEQATFENDTWTFVNLHLSNSLTADKLNLTASAEDSHVTITAYQPFNTTFYGVRLRYMVVGQGKQTFNFGIDTRGGEFGVVFNGVYMAENEGYSIAPDATLTITGATGNVSISYYDFLDSLGGGPGAANLPVYQQHSVGIATAAAVAVTLVLTVAIWTRNRKKEADEDRPKSQPTVYDDGFGRQTGGNADAS